MKENRKILLKIIYIALFTALCFVGTMIAIPFGASKVHLGNFFCILAGLLCGGIIGGLAGSLGMGLNDIVFGYPPSTYLRTMILKFLMGFIVGTLFRILLKKNANAKLMNMISTLILLALSITLLTLYLIGYEKITIWIVVLCFVLFALFLSIFIFSFKFDTILNSISFSLTIALATNVVGEFLLRWLFTVIQGVESQQALATSIAKIPASLMTSIVTIIFVIPLFYPLYKATRKINAFNDLDGILVLNKEPVQKNKKI